MSFTDREYTKRFIHSLAREGKPASEIAFLVHWSEGAVARELQEPSVDLTKTAEQPITSRADVPEHILQHVHELAADDLSIEQIAYMLRLHPDVVKAELEKVTTTQEPAERAQRSLAKPTK